MDVKTSFLYGILKGRVYMDQPRNYSIPGSEQLVCKLHKAIYELRQSPRLWYKRIIIFLKSIGMHRSTNDQNLYYIKAGNDKIILVVYADDLFITGSYERKISWLKQKLNKDFNMTDLGPIQRYLGIKFIRLPTNMFLLQHQYVLDMLAEFNMLQCKPKHVPLPPGIQLLSDMNSSLVNPNEYCQIVGKLLFLPITHPDLAYAFCTVSRYMSCPQQPHLDAVRYILRYLKKLADFGLYYQTGQHFIQGFTDADWASCRETRHLIGGYCFLMGGASIT
jgi:hypothetical protein